MNRTLNTYPSRVAEAPVSMLMSPACACMSMPPTAECKTGYRRDIINVCIQDTVWKDPACVNSASEPAYDCLSG